MPLIGTEEKLIIARPRQVNNQRRGGLCIMILAIILLSWYCITYSQKSNYTDMTPTFASVIDLDGERPTDTGGRADISQRNDIFDIVRLEHGGHTPGQKYDNLGMHRVIGATSMNS